MVHHESFSHIAEKLIGYEHISMPDFGVISHNMYREDNLPPVIM